MSETLSPFANPAGPEAGPQDIEREATRDEQSESSDIERS